MEEAKDLAQRLKSEKRCEVLSDALEENMNMTDPSFFAERLKVTEVVLQELQGLQPKVINYLIIVKIICKRIRTYDKTYKEFYSKKTSLSCYSVFLQLILSRNC